MKQRKDSKKKRSFYHRLRRNIAIILIVILFSLSLGVFGYHFIAHLSIIDALLNASMILTGMGPVHVMKTNPRKFLLRSMHSLVESLFSPQ